MRDTFFTDDLILSALKEDMPFGDATTDSIIEEGSCSRARIIAKECGTIAGIRLAEHILKLVDSDAVFKKFFIDGDTVNAGDVIAEMKGSTRALLKAERTMLNFMQRLSGIATMTAAYNSRIKDTQAVLVDTRKTTPGLRLAEKYAVKAGGGQNHRMSLSDGILIKDNHIAAAGSIRLAVEKARRGAPHTLKVEVETESLAQVQEAIDCHADIIMLDNMPLEMMRRAVKLINQRAVVEASGNISLENIRQVAETGVDLISVGKLTHSAPSLDISMRIVSTEQ